MLKRAYRALHAKVYEFFYHIVEHALIAHNIDGKLRFALRRDAHDIQKALQLRALAESADFVQQHMANVRSVETLEDLWMCSLAAVPDRDQGLYCEFGVWEGRSTNFLSSHMKTTLYAFDSFEGLPERWFDVFDRGHFKVERIPAVRENVRLVKGYFDDTLPGFVKEHPEKVAFLHIDCDLYSSTVSIFKHLGNQIGPGTVMVFDEWYNYPGWQEGEYKALLEFVRERGLGFEYIVYNRHDAQVTVRITQGRG